MVRPVLKQMTSPDLFDMNDGGVPADPRSFALLVQCLIGEEGPAADVFDFVALTPDHFANEVPATGGLPGRGYFVMQQYDFDAIRAFVEGWVAKSAAEDWEKSAAILCRAMMWEFEDTAVA